MADVSGISASETTEAYSLEDLESRELDSIETTHSASKDLDKLQDEKTEAQHLSLMRQVAELSSKILETLQKISRDSKESIENLKRSVRTNTEKSAGQMEGKGDFNSGMAFISFSVSVLAIATLSGNNQQLARAFTDNFRGCTEVIAGKYDGQTSIFQMKSSLAQTELQNKANAQQSQGSFKGSVENLLAEACRNQTSLARSGG